jgi:hypothetical protein
VLHVWGYREPDFIACLHCGNSSSWAAIKLVAEYLRVCHVRDGAVGVVVRRFPDVLPVCTNVAIRDEAGKEICWKELAIISAMSDEELLTVGVCQSRSQDCHQAVRLHF